MSCDEAESLAADLLADAHTGDPLIGLPPTLAPSSRRAAYGIQSAAVGRRSGVVGWKIAATSAAGQRHINVDGPLAGRLAHHQVRGPDHAASLSGNHMRLAEPELAFVLASDMPARPAGYSHEEVIANVLELRLGIELPSTRYVDPTTVGALQLIADNACAHEYVLGPAALPSWRSEDLALVAITATSFDAAGEVVEYAEGSGAEVLGNPLSALTWLVNELSAMGIGLEAGQFVTTGTCTTPVRLIEGGRIRAHYNGLGTLWVSIASEGA